MKVAQKRKRGRPRKAEGQAKSEAVLLKMTAAEKIGFTTAAEAAGLPLSAWMRERLRIVASIELKAAGKKAPWQTEFRVN